MGKQSTRENKTIYQICREEAGLTRSEASEKMTAVSDSKIEKFEYEIQEPTPYDIIQMADAYRRPDLCNYYCSHKCEIGHRYVPEVEVTDLSNIILETIASLNEINPLTTRLIQIARDGKISDDEIRDFAFISNKLDEISLAIDSLNLWVDKTAGEQGLNITSAISVSLYSCSDRSICIFSQSFPIFASNSSVLFPFPCSSRKSTTCPF